MKLNRKQKKIYNSLIENYHVLYPSALLVRKEWTGFDDLATGESELLPLLDGVVQSIKDHRPLYNTARLSGEELAVLREYYISQKGDIKIFPSR